MDVSLKGKTSDTRVSETSEAGLGISDLPRPRRNEASTATDQVTEFLIKYPTAKIVIVVEMHCLENGRFVWKGQSPTTYEACSLLEVCLPYISRFPLSHASTDCP